MGRLPRFLRYGATLSRPSRSRGALLLFFLKHTFTGPTCKASNSLQVISKICRITAHCAGNITGNGHFTLCCCQFMSARPIMSRLTGCNSVSVILGVVKTLLFVFVNFFNFPFLAITFKRGQKLSFSILSWLQFPVPKSTQLTCVCGAPDTCDGRMEDKTLPSHKSRPPRLPCPPENVKKINNEMIRLYMHCKNSLIIHKEKQKIV